MTSGATVTAGQRAPGRRRRPTERQLTVPPPENDLPPSRLEPGDAVNCSRERPQSHGRRNQRTAFGAVWSSTEKRMRHRQYETAGTGRRPPARTKTGTVGQNPP